MATVQDVMYQGIVPAPYIQTRTQELLNTIFGVQGTPDLDPSDPDYVAPITGLIEKPRDIPAQQVAAFTPVQEAISGAANVAAANVGASSLGLGAFEPYMQQANVATQGAMTALDRAQQQFTPNASNISQFMDPYQSLVTQEALRELDRQGAMAENQLSASAIASGAFGGGREGVQRAELGRNLQDIKSKRIFEDLQRNYLQALAGSQSAQESASARSLYAAPQYRGLAGTALTQGQLARSLPQQDVAFLQGIGALQQQQAQAGLEAQRLNLLAQQAEPFERLDFGAGILGGLPYPSQTITSSPYQYSPYSQALGLGIGALSAFG